MRHLPEQFWQDLRSGDPARLARAAKLLHGGVHSLSRREWRLLEFAVSTYDVTAYATPLSMQLTQGILVQLIRHHSRPPQGHQPMAALDTPGSAFNWFTAPLRERALLMSIISRDGYTCDESAVGYARSILGKRDFPLLDVQKCVAPGPNWLPSIRNSQARALMFVARMQRFGKDVVDRFACPDLRFVPSQAERPARLSRRGLDWDYHAAHEMIAERCRTKMHTTIDGDKPRDQQRVDYGFLQRHPCMFEGRQIHVYRVWGPSSLGTEGAALFLADQFPQLAGGQPDEPLMLPDGEKLGGKPVPDDAPFEAMVEVRAQETHGGWSPLRVDLKRMYLGDYGWCPKRREWFMATPTEIRLEYHSGGLTGIRLDGQRDALDPDNENGRMLAAAVNLAVRREDRQFSISDLLRQPAIWSPSPVPAEKHVGNAVSVLKRRWVHTLESLGDGQWQFGCDLVVVDDRNVTVYPALDVVPEPPRPAGAKPATKGKAKSGGGKPK